MMATGHAISGAVGWLGLCLAAGLVDRHPTPVQITAGAAIAAGFAIFPDIDHPKSRVARTLGWFTRALARVFTFICDLIRDATCGHCATPGTYGHRTLSHTAVFAVLVGAGVCLAGSRGNLVAAAIVVGIGAGLAVAGLTGSRVGTIVIGVAAGIAVHQLGGGVDWWWLGVPVGWGILAHALGDGLTEQAVPLWWPVKIRGCTWRRVGVPRWLRFRTGGWVERVLSVVLVGLGAVAGWLLLTGA
ncbi:MAG TPA: metal-dependent hydrolase [Natronosporangium sp.]